MRTVTYDPLIGKTAECDENSRVTYFEYDNLGKLRFIRDDHRNVVKMFENNSVSPAKQNGCPGTYANHLTTELFTKPCPAGYVGTDVPYTIPAGRYTSAISQEDADALAEVDMLTNGPGAAVSGGSCRLIYYSQQLVSHDTTQSCTEGQKGGGVTYTVPSGRYTSLISQDDADQKAREDTAANAQAFANDPANASCTLNTDPVWSWEDGGATKCMNVNGVPHTFAQATDINPNSYTYGQMTWKDFALSPTTCPVPPVYYARLSYENVVSLYDGSQYADIVVRFYSDIARTQPYAATTTVWYNVTDNCSNNTIPSYQNAVSNTYIIIGSAMVISFPQDSNCNPNEPPYQLCLTCDVSYYLTPNDDYTILY
jgi:hypothetical protein